MVCVCLQVFGFMYSGTERFIPILRYVVNVFVRNGSHFVDQSHPRGDIIPPTTSVTTCVNNHSCSSFTGFNARKWR